RKTVIDYIYDFGDCWEHRLTVTNVRAGEPGVSYPRYIGGERNGPFEDCGGIPGLLRTAGSPRRPKPPKSCRREGMVRRLRSRHVRRTANQICPRPHRKPP